ncbi:MAG: hypothetical protein GY832_03980 [Chloroflexi bacterium]|nr:hypothetical protein [Chloroflexota bacterium]
MDLMRVDPRKRLTRLKFDPRAEAREHTIHLGFYTCPHCRERIRFKTSNFLGHYAYPKLIAADHAQFDVFRPMRHYGDHGPQAHLDFYCPGCKSPVRIVFKKIEFAMGAYYAVVTDVIEARCGTIRHLT